MTRTRMEINTQWLRHLYFNVLLSINTLLSGILHFITSAMKQGIERNVWLNRYIPCKKRKEKHFRYTRFTDREVKRDAFAN